MIFLAGRDRHTQRTLLRSIHDRLSKHPGVEQVRYRPSRRRPRYVVADIDSPVFLGAPHEAETARLELRFWYPEGVEYEYYRLNWVEPDRELMVGFHQDGDHSDLGPCHLQVTRERHSSVTRRGSTTTIRWPCWSTGSGSSRRYWRRSTGATDGPHSATGPPERCRFSASR
jgi:hypothetical protein